jgi:aryl-alcohol dehydrogenase-like predicted oxidoreductase
LRLGKKQDPAFVEKRISKIRGDNHYFNNRTDKGNMGYKTNAEVMAHYVIGNYSEEPHTALEDAQYYELPILVSILKKKNWTRDSYIVSGKVFFGTGGQSPTQKGLNRKHIFEGCHQALERFQLEYLDLFLCHRPDKNTPIEETVWAMHQLIMQGKILYWGTSEWSAQEIMEAHMFAKQNHLIGPIVEQPEYNMFSRHKVEVEFSQIYKTVGLGTTIWSPLASGLLSGKYNDQFPRDTRLGIEGLEWLKDKNITLE